VTRTALHAIIAQISLGFKQLAHGLHGALHADLHGCVLLAGAVTVRISCNPIVWCDL
jgi:hypothetical protein